MARVIILMYHIVDTPKSSKEAKYCCKPSEFAKQMQYLATSEYPLLNLNDIASILAGNKELTADSVAVTFDDGFEDFYHNALPILSRYKIPATLFMVSNRIDQYNDWMVKNNFPKRKLLTIEQLNELVTAGIVIGSHSQSHSKLSEISDNIELLNQEVAGAKKELEKALGISINHFAYPYGLYNDDVVESVKQSGYITACSTRSGFNRWNIDRFLLRRIEVYGSDSLWQFNQKVKYGSNEMSRLFLIKYWFFRAKSKLF